ncbi:M23 family metallopeptidase [Caldanaerobacter sp.]|uniref:M23 family metallopeptidase n=1 Tax=Caldanaerobacter sp. TaxID=2930036 RepID=UPI003C759022
MAKKKQKYIDIMVIPDPNRQIKTIRISIPLLKTFFTVAVLLIFASTISLIYFTKTTSYLYTVILEKDKQISELTQIKEEQDKKIAALNKNAQMVNEKIKNLTELEEKVRRMVGLSSPPASRGNVIRSMNPDNSISYDDQTTTQLLTEIDQKTSELNDLISKVEARLNYLAALPSAYPVYGTITSPFGMRKNPFGSGYEFHPGIDISVPIGTPVKAAGKGVVVYAGWLAGYGKAVIIDHGYGIQSVYGHNSQILVKVGQTVERGDVIAKSGNTGRSTGPHVHFEIRVNGNPVNPMKYLAKEN